MASLEHAVRTVHDTILNQFRASHGEGSTVQLAFEFGTPIPIQGFANPPEIGGYSSAKVVEFLSEISNFVPDLKDSFVERGLTTVDGQYELMLLGSTVRNSSHLEFFAAIKESAKRDFDVTLGTSRDGIPVRFRPTYATPENWYDPNSNDVWTSYSFHANDDPPPPVEPLPFNPKLIQWQVVPSDFNSVILEGISLAPAVEPLPIDPPQAIAPALTATLDRSAFFSRRDSLRVTSPDFSPFVELRSPHWDAVVNSPITQLVNRDPGIFSGSNRGPLLIDREAQAFIPIRDIATPQPVVTDRISISFQTCTVLLFRPWLSDGFLRLPNWYVPFFRKGHFSGSEESSLFSNVPVACVMIRNLSIQAQWSPDDSAAVENSANLGPFSLLGRQFDQAAGSLTIPGMQVVAWICDAMPFLPPTDDPALEPA